MDSCFPHLVAGTVDDYNPLSPQHAGEQTNALLRATGPKAAENSVRGVDPQESYFAQTEMWHSFWKTLSSWWGKGQESCSHRCLMETEVPQSRSIPLTCCIQTQWISKSMFFHCTDSWPQNCGLLWWERNSVQRFYSRSFWNTIHLTFDYLHSLQAGGPILQLVGQTLRCLKHDKEGFRRTTVDCSLRILWLTNYSWRVSSQKQQNASLYKLKQPTGIKTTPPSSHSLPLFQVFSSSPFLSFLLPSFHSFLSFSHPFIPNFH